MKIAITGSNGFIGKYLVNALLNKGHKIFCLDLIDGIDITNWEQVSETQKFDVVIHLAARSFVPQSFIEPIRFYKTNFNGTLNMLELCRKYKARMIYVSTYVYGNPDYLPINENHPVVSLNPYTETKLLGEQLCRKYHEFFKVPTTILRPFNIFGPGQNELFLIPRIINQASSGIITLMDPRPKRDFLFIEDFISLFVKVVEKENIEFEIFNVGSGKSYSVIEVAEKICRISGRNTNITYSGEIRKNEILETIADISKAEKNLNWSPIYKFESGLREIIKYYQEKLINKS